MAQCEDSIKDSTYTTPLAGAARMGVDPAMAEMEQAVNPQVLGGFEKAHPAPCWLFGEDRTLAVRNDIVPAHWLVNGTDQYRHFSGSARPGEFYVFQACVIAGKEPLVELLPVLKMPALEGAICKAVSRPATVKPGEVKPFWMSVQVPATARAGEYRGTVTAANETMIITLKVEGAPIADSGTGEAWRLARLKWLDSTIGESDTEVTRPFTPVVVNEEARTLDILGRRITLDASGIPSQYTSYFSGSVTKILGAGRDAFSATPSLEIVKDGMALEFVSSGFKFTRETPVGVEWEASSHAGAMQLQVKGRLEYDGRLQLSMTPSCANAVTVDDVRFTVPFAKEIVKYTMGLGHPGGSAPARLDWAWDVAKNQDALWLGDASIGMMLRFKGGNYRRPLINAYYAFQPLLLPESWGGGRIKLETGEGGATLTANSGRKMIAATQNPVFDIDWYFTPFKPLDVEKHFTDRYYHAEQGSPVEDPAALHRDGARIIEIHHNRLCNPFLNYPYDDESVGRLTDFVKKAHDDAMRVTVYYTTRELTQNLPEFFALRSLDGEVILPRKAGVPWPVTNPAGPHPWLKAHVGTDIVPGWREELHYDYKSKLDLAVVTTPDSRWNNFYLEGLNYLVRKVGIDGIYVDDSALNGQSMQRARRILDADGDPSRRINMHSWNHFNGLGAWGNSSIVFMEFYPYLDGLWHGEGFDSNASPEYMLVEMSGIPYGLMSELLERPNPWHGMVFGMRTRWPWSGDPREQWKLEDKFGIAHSEYIGWFDPACPVKADNPNVKVSVFKRDGSALIAIGNWGGNARVKLAIDWKSLGIDPAKASLSLPEIKGLQTAGAYRPGDSIPVSANCGALIIIGTQ